MKIVTCLAKQMTEKIAVEVYAKICFGKKCENQQKWVKTVFLIHCLTPLKKVWHNLKPYSERFLSEFYENGKQKLPNTKNDWENCSWSWCKNLVWEKV